MAPDPIPLYFPLDPPPPSLYQDITRISMPVHFNEPTSFTQRLIEDLEYAHLLDQAAACDDPMRRMALVAVFANAMYASSATGMR